jgi:tetratricopeptide (TPR) repeat protein
VRVNRANITARRDLATIYLGLLRPKRAIELLEEGLALAPDDPELLYLHGLSLYRAGDYERALQQELAALERDARVRQGHPYFVAGDALLALKRWDDAADAFERYIDFNSSDVSAHARLARAYAGSGDAAAAQKWLLEGLSTWHALPGAMKRRQFGPYLAAQWARVTVLKQPLAIAVALFLLACCVLGARSLHPVVVGWLEPNPDDDGTLVERARRAEPLCGKVSTGEFEGEYDVVDDDHGAFTDFKITHDRILYGKDDAQELCLTKLKERKPGALRAEAVLRFRVPSEDVASFGPSDNILALMDVRIDRGSDRISLSMAPVTHPNRPTRLILRRR